MNSNSYNPYGYNPYNYKSNTYVFVNGLEGAKAYPMMPNQSLLLMDSDSPLCFQKSTDNIGKATLRCFKLVEVEEKELKGVIDDSNNEELKNEISELNKKIEELYSLVKKESK